MTSRGKSTVRGFETEIEKSREEANWKKAIELALQLKQRSPQHESLAHFLIGEGKLEAYLEAEPVRGAETAARAAHELAEARGFLASATDDAGKRAGVALDAHLLLGKLHYAAGAPADALDHFARAELNTLTEKDLPVRSLRIVAESFAIKGLCLEALAGGGGGGSRYKQAEREAEVVRAFELAADLTLLYLQRTGAAAGPVLDAALLRAPALLVRGARLGAAVARQRDMLAAVECAASAPLRLTLARQLAELLLRAATGPLYEPPAPAPPPGPWRPRRYAAINQFVPRDEHEEALLVLLVGEALAVRDAVLSQSAEFAAARDLSLHNAVTVVDLVALLAARWGQLCLVLESLERAMKFSFGCQHVWRQRALATAAAAPRPPQPPPQPGGAGWAGSVRAAGVLRRALALAPRDAPLALVAAHTAYNMGWIEEGIELAERGVAAAEEGEAEPPMLARACLAAAMGHQQLAQKTSCRLEKEAARAAALRLLLRAVRLDDNDHVALYQLALHYTRAGQLNDAMDACRAGLRARADCAGGLRLAAALWSCACAGRRGARALAAARLARDHYPRAAWPLAALAALQLRWEAAPAALDSGRRLLALLHAPPERLDARSDSAASPSRALSEAASSAAGPAGGGAAGAARAAAWLTLAELCGALGRAAAAAGCVAEAAALAPADARVLRARGQLAAAARDWPAARLAFQDALALQPTDVDTLVQLGAAFYNLGWLRLAEKTLRDAAALQPRRADTWRRLALVLAAAGEPAAAADCAAAAIALQPLEPALPLPA